jgi:hypothetical protein
MLLSLNESFSGAATGIIRTGEIIQGIFFDQPGVMDLVSREVTHTAEAFYRFRVDLELSGSFQDTKIIIQYRHKFISNIQGVSLNVFKYCFDKTIITIKKHKCQYDWTANSEYLFRKYPVIPMADNGFE